jgi:type I restriction-modification system DNA methylase subunit
MAGAATKKPLSIASAAQILTDGMTYRHNRSTLFRDFLSVSTIAFRNAFEPKGELWDAREAEYFKIIAKYEKDEIFQMRECLTALMQLAKQDHTDLMGELYMSLEIGSKDMGQFFTPYQISRLMAMLTLDRPSIDQAVAENGYIEFNEPTCGAGGMIIAAAESIRSLGLDPARHMRVTAQDIDMACVQMTYLNCTFYDIPATIVHGNVLALEERSVIKTPSLLALEGLDHSKAA